MLQKQQLITDKPVKSYVSVTSFILNETYPINALLDGSENDFLSSEAMFRLACDVYENEALAIKVAVRRNRGNKSVYILKMGCTADEVLKLAAIGQFSIGIIEAVNAKDWYLSSLLKDPKKVKVEIISNRKFNLNLLQEALSNDRVNSGTSGSSLDI